MMAIHEKFVRINQHQRFHIERNAELLNIRRKKNTNKTILIYPKTRAHWTLEQRSNTIK